MALRRETSEQAEIWDIFRFSWDREGEGLDETLARVTQHCATCFEASGASLFLQAPGKDGYQLAARSGLDNSIPKTARVRAGEGIAGACLEAQKPLIVTDPNQHPALFGRSVRRRSEIGAAMVIPLIANSGCIGVMNLSRPSGAQPFSSKDLMRAESVVRHIALAVENARLFAEASAATTEARRLQKRLLEIVQSLGVAVIVLDEREQVSEANREALRLLGREAGGAEYAALLACILETLHEAVGGKANRRRFHDDATSRSWSISCTPLNSGGAAAAIEEVTEHERSEREMSRLSRMAEIGQMTAAIAHEIRNPLTSIVVASRVLRDSPEQSVELGSLIETEALKLNGLCEEFLEFARPISVSHADVDLQALAAKLARQHRHEFDEEGVRLTVRIETSEPMIKGDAPRLEQAMRNLLLNALQACEAGGAVFLNVEDHGFSVTDDGAGMSEETVGRLFTPFFTTRPQGTGLGLSNVRKIIEAHGGTVRVVSEPGKGSTFAVRLREEEFEG